ncbi:MAG TPA: fumarylacetoacetate hydrolase family protein, partial [Thermodesulfobacteriota bacterium]
TRIGAVVDSTVVDLNAVLGEGALPGDMAAFLAAGQPAMAKAREAVERFRDGGHAKAGRPLAEVELLAPVPRPPKIMMGGRNYDRHISELRSTGEHIPRPPYPRIFAKYHTSVTGPGAPVYYPKMVTKLDFEGEFTVVIGKLARNVKESDWLDYVAGYTIVSDVTARDVQATGELITSKNFETFCPMGPWIVTPDEVPDPHNLTVRLYINDKKVSESNTSEMIYRIPQYIAFLSQVMPLEPGDILTTGSPPGPGMYQNPPILLKVGDVTRIEVEHVGVLENRIEAAP